MSRALLSGALAVATFLCAGEAWACRINRPPEARIAFPYDAVILAQIESAGPGDSLGNASPAWHAVARRVRSVEGGVVSQRTFEIGRSGDSAMCDDGQPIAKVGETWVLYLSRRPEGGYWAANSYPLEFARQIDPRLRRR